MSEQLQKALQNGDLKTLKACIAEGDDIYFTNNPASIPALHIATCFCHVHIMKYLLDIGFPIETKDRFGMTAIFYADELGPLNCLIRHGADINVRKLNSRTPVEHAVNEGYLDVVKHLIECGASTEPDLNGKNLLMIASDSQLGTDLIPYLATLFDVNVVDNKGYTALHYAYENNVSESIIELIKAGADDHLVDEKFKASFRRFADEDTKAAVESLINQRELDIISGSSEQEITTL